MAMNRWISKEIIEQTRKDVEALQKKVEGDKKEKSHHRANADKIYANLNALDKIEEEKDVTPSQKHETVQAVLDSIDHFLLQAQASKKIKNEEYLLLEAPINISYTTLQRGVKTGWEKTLEAATVNPADVKLQLENNELLAQVKAATEKQAQAEATQKLVETEKLDMRSMLNTSLAELHNKQKENEELLKKLDEVKATMDKQISTHEAFKVAYQNDRVEKEAAEKAKVAAEDARARAEKVRDETFAKLQAEEKLKTAAIQAKEAAEQEVKRLLLEIEVDNSNFNAYKDEVAKAAEAARLIAEANKKAEEAKQEAVNVEIQTDNIVGLNNASEAMETLDNNSPISTINIVEDTQPADKAADINVAINYNPVTNINDSSSSTSAVNTTVDKQINNNIVNESKSESNVTPGMPAHVGHWKTWAVTSGLFLAGTAASILSYLGILAVSAAVVSNPLTLLIATATLVMSFMTGVHAHRERIAAQAPGGPAVMTSAKSQAALPITADNKGSNLSIQIKLTQSPKSAPVIATGSPKTAPVSNSPKSAGANSEEQAATIPNNVTQLLSANKTSPLNKATQDKIAQEQAAMLAAQQAAENNNVVVNAV